MDKKQKKQLKAIAKDNDITYNELVNLYNKVVEVTPELSIEDFIYMLKVGALEIHDNEVFWVVI